MPSASSGERLEVSAGIDLVSSKDLAASPEVSPTDLEESVVSGAGLVKTLGVSDLGKALDETLGDVRRSGTDFGGSFESLGEGTCPMIHNYLSLN